jgi:TolA-binding protein
MLEDDIRRVREREVPWNELRQAGALRRIERARATPKRPSRRAPLVVMAGLCAAVACFALWRGRGHRAITLATAPATMAAVATAPETSEAILRLADGSIARQAPGALVQVQAVEEERTELLQTLGSVHYEVAPNPRRRFVVRAHDVDVNVLGTIFLVDVKPLAVSVHVERGQVEVAQQGRRVTLAAGEGITFETSGGSFGAIAQKIESGGSGPSQPSAGAESSLHVRGARAASPPPRERTADASSPLLFLEQADRARANGDLDGAAHALRQLLQQYPNDTRVALAEFVLGRVESARGSTAEAVRAFEACAARAPGGALGEDALAEWARARSRSGDAAGAASLAQRYLATYPGGVHRHAMQRLVDGEH